MRKLFAVFSTLCLLALALQATPSPGAPLGADQIPADLARAAGDYADALAAGDTAKGWQLLSEDSRRSLDVAGWHRAFQTDTTIATPPTAALIEPLAASDPPPAIEDVLVRTDEAFISLRGNVQITQTVVLVREKNSWRVDLARTDRLNSGRAAEDFLAAVREREPAYQTRGSRPVSALNMPLLRIWLGRRAKGYKVLQADLDGDRAEVIVAAQVPLGLVLHANRSGAGWAVDLNRPVVPIDSGAENPLQEAVEYSDRTACEEQLRQLARGIQMYAARSDNILPDAGTWLDQIRPFLSPTLSAHCPKDPTQGISYAFNANLSGQSLPQIANAAAVPMLFESTLRTRNPADTGKSWADSRHLGGNLVAYADGHVAQALRVPSFQVSLGPSDDRTSAPAPVRPNRRPRPEPRSAP